MRPLAITATNCITAVGHDGRMTAASVRAGICRFSKNEDFLDLDGNPITVAQIKGIEDDNPDTADRMSEIAKLCLESLLKDYFQNNQQSHSQIHLFMGVSSDERPGQRFAERCTYPLQRALEEWCDKAAQQVIPQGNASMQYAIAQAAELIESNPAAICIIGGIDSLLRQSTLNWFEQAGRLKSESYCRQQGLIAGEAAGFVIIENLERAKQAGRTVLAHITGLGQAKEPHTRAAKAPSRNSGLTAACHAAMRGIQDKNIRTVFGDLNGENSRAVEWSMAEMRCFKERNVQRYLHAPGSCYGDIGAASGVVMANIVTQGFARKWLETSVLVFCSDDHGRCGAVVLEKG